MKVKEKIKKVLKALLAIIMFLPHKIYAVNTISVPASAQEAYGVTLPTVSTYAKMFAAPIIVIIIGLIVYYKKSKHKISEKIALTLLILCFICFIIWIFAHLGG